MSVLEDVLREEYERSLRLSRQMSDELKTLPKGCIRVRIVRGHEYYYLNYRVEDKVRSDYIPASNICEMRKMIARRKKLKQALKEQESSRKQIERALGKKLRYE